MLRALRDVVDNDGGADDQAEPRLDRCTDTDAQALDQFLRAGPACQDRHLISPRSMAPMVVLDGLLLLGLLPREHSAIDVEIERVDGEEAADKADDRYHERAQLERLRQHFEADGREQYPAGEAERERHEERRRLAPQGDHPAKGRGERRRKSNSQNEISRHGHHRRPCRTSGNAPGMAQFAPVSRSRRGVR